ncbi:MAG: prolyl oligopeptidase family serine peptidase [Chitinophagaceae bacterium]
MKRVGAPAISPHGKWVVFAITDPSYDEKEQSSDLCITAADGSGKPRKITNSKAVRRLANSESRWGTSDGFYERELMNGGTPWMQTKTFKEQNPMRLAANFKTPILVTAGEQDFRIPLSNVIENWHILYRLNTL